MSDPVKVIDRRGQNSERTKATGDPGLLLKLRRTGNPREFLAIFPFNRQREQYFTVNGIEDEGFTLGLHPPEKPTRPDRRAIEAARKKLRKVIEQARKLHAQAGAAPPPAVAPSQVQEPERAQ